jgi:putative transposase
MSCHEAAELNNLVPSTVVKWTQRLRLTGSPAAKPMGGRRPYLLEGARDWLLARIREKPDLTLHALLSELAGERGVVVACDTLWRFLKREGISFKKNAARQRAGST